MVFCIFTKEGNPDFPPKPDPRVILPAGVSDISPSSDQRLLLRAPESGMSKDATVPADGAEAGWNVVRGRLLMVRELCIYTYK